MADADFAPRPSFGSRRRKIDVGILVFEVRTTEWV
jgi:hypothetical protein